jgi:hypothetical protein
MLKSYKHVYKVILSCKCEEHLAAANRLITLFYIKWNNDCYLERLETRYIKKRQKIWY